MMLGGTGTQYIEKTVAKTDLETHHKVTQNTLEGVDACLQEGGGHWTFSASAVKPFCKF
jgi:hypothetical protein